MRRITNTELRGELSDAFLLRRFKQRAHKGYNYEEVNLNTYLESLLSRSTGPGLSGP
jgi:hypothetical protein